MKEGIDALCDFCTILLSCLGLITYVFLKVGTKYEIILYETRHFVLFLLCYCCVLFNFLLKLRSHCRLLVLCFVWASCVAFCLYGVHLFLRPLQRRCSSKYFEGHCHVVICPLWVLLSKLVLLNLGSGVSFCLSQRLLLLLLFLCLSRASCSFAV